MNNFTGGAIGSKFEGRTDTDIYKRSGREMINMFPMSSGGMTRLPGTEYVSLLPTNVRMIEFPVTTGQIFVLEFGDEELKIRRDGAYVQSDGSDLVIGTPYGVSEIHDVQFVRSAKHVYFAHRTYPPKYLLWAGIDSFGVDGLGDLITIPFTVETNDDPVFDGPGDYPGAVALWGSRLWWGGTNNEPDTMWASRSFYSDEATVGEHLTNYATYSPVEFTYIQLSDSQDWDSPSEPETEEVTETKDITTSSHSIKMAPASGHNNAIKWMASGDSLIVGTEETEFVVPRGVTPRNLMIDARTRYGSAPIQGELLDNAVLFIQGAGKKVREYHYRSDDEGYASPELTFVNDEITAAGIKQIAYQREPEPIVWFVLNDGTMAGLLYNKGAGALGWFKYEITNALITSAIIIPGVGEDILYIVVKRGSAYSLEKMAPLFPSSESNCRYMHSFMEVTVVADVATGLTHLEGLSVIARDVVDGTEYASAVVTAGSVTFPGAGSGTFAIGIDYSEESRWKSLRLYEGGGQGKIQNTQNLLVRTWRASDGEISYSNDEFWERMDIPTAWHSGDGEYPFRGDWTREAYVYFRPIGAAPLGILAFSLEQEVS